MSLEFRLQRARFFSFKYLNLNYFLIQVAIQQFSFHYLYKIYFISCVIRQLVPTYNSNYVFELKYLIT